ncbi:sensor histidine kinase [Thermodesulfobacteriota bacterium]
MRLELEHITFVADRWSVPAGSEESPLDEYSIGEFFAAAGDRCIYAGSYSSGEVNSLGSSSMQSDVVTLIAKVERTNQRSFVLSGSAFQALISGNRYLLLADPVKPQTGENEIFVLVWDLSPIYTAIKEDQRIVLVYLLFNVLILTVIGFFRLVNLVIKPMDRLITVADQYQLSNSFFYSVGKEYSEFDQLNTSLGNMLKRIESDHTVLQENVKSLEQINRELIKYQDEVVRAEKLASVGRLSAGLAHEIGNPITIIQGYIELLQKDDLSEEQKRNYGDKALEELHRVNKLIGNLLDYARETKKEAEPIQIDDSLLENVQDIVGYEKEWANVELRSAFEPALIVHGNRESLRQVLLNCVLNGIDAIHAHGEKLEQGVIEVNAFKDESEGNLSVLITIKDNGVGISEDQRQSVFDPFYSTKHAGKGTGLGLYVSHLIIENMGGRIGIESNEQGGATLTIELPGCED